MYEKTCFITVSYRICIFFWSKLQTLFKGNTSNPDAKKILFAAQMESTKKSCYFI